MMQSVPAGFIHPPDTVMEAATKELSEELDIRADEIAEIYVTGIAETLPPERPRYFWVYESVYLCRRFRSAMAVMHGKYQV